jgi:hypothetical protein
MHKCALKICEPSCVPRTAKPFFILVVHSLLGAVGHVAAPELHSQKGKAPSHGTRGSTGAPLRKAEPRAMGHVAAPELISSMRQGLKLRDTWQCRSSAQQGGEVQGRETHGSIGTHLVKETRSGDEEHVVAPELTSVRRRGPGPRDTWWHRSPPLHGGVIRSYSLRDSAWMYVIFLILT